MDDPPLIQRPPHRDASLARVQGLPWLLFIVTFALAVWFAWKAFGPEDLGDPLATSLVALEKQDKLTVFSAQLSPVVASEDSQLFGALKSRQVAVIPARVDYTLDLSKMDKSRLAWNATTHTMAVQLPALTVGRPNLDEGRAQYLREGAWITNNAQARLTRDNTRLAEQQAVQQAANPVLMDLARSAAREAISQNLAIPLQVAGYGAVKVDVHFDGEPAGSSSAD